MIFRLENAGPIRSAEIDLGPPLVVFAGPNHTGKTWMAWAIYAFLKARPVVPVLQNLVNDLLQSTDYSVGSPGGWRPVLLRVLEQRAAHMSEEFRNSFASDAQVFGKSRCIMTIAEREIVEHRTFDRLAALLKVESAFCIVRSEGDRIVLRAKAIEDGRLSFGPELTRENLSFTRQIVEKLHGDERTQLSARLAEGIALSVLGLDWPYSLVSIAPTERADIYRFARELTNRRAELVDALLGDAAGATLPTEVTRYPWPVRDTLRTAANLAALSQRESPLADLADHLETSVLGGEVSLTTHGDLQFSSKGTTMPLALSASLVKSLASITFHYRHLAQPGELLIIDEPELNLHPDQQRKVARFLVRVIHRGGRVLMSTHSDWLLRELSCLVVAGRLTPEQRTEFGIDETEVLKPEELGLYLFGDGTATRLPVDERGLSVKSIDDATHSLHDLEQQLYFLLDG